MNFHFEDEDKDQDLDKDQDYECGICIEPMKTLSFKQPVSVEAEREDLLDSVDSSCVRLKCGHAFHFSCQVPAMRMGKFCSLCRDELVNHHHQIQIVGAGNDVWELEISPVTGNQINLIIENNQEVENALIAENGANEELQLLRSKLNESLSTHRKLANDLKKTRARFLRECFRSFRAQHKPKFDESQLRIKNFLRLTKNLEDSILRRRGFSARQIHEFFSTDLKHDLNELVSNGAIGGDPARHRFWYR
jgi:hypothetical protein